MGRMQVIDQRPTLVADVAHNPDGARALMAVASGGFRLRPAYRGRRDHGRQGHAGFPRRACTTVADLVILTRPASERAADTEDPERDGGGARTRRTASFPAPGAALQSALSEAGEGDLVLITGSHYTVGDIMTSLGVGQAL